MSRIAKIHAREVLDSRGNPTVEVEMGADTGQTASAIVPSGASTGEHEALELRDGVTSRYRGKGVLQACENVNEVILKDLTGFETGNQSGFDSRLVTLDGTPNKSSLGANALLGCSMAYARLSAACGGVWLYEYFNRDAALLPVPMMNVINGGAHADSGLDFQEFMVMPLGIESFPEQLRAGSEIFHALRKLLKDNGFTTSVGDEGGFAPQLKSNEEALVYLVKAIKMAGYSTDQVKIALDIAATEFFKDGVYKVGDKSFSSDEMISIYAALTEKYPIVSIEDGLSEDDWEGWVKLTAQLGAKIQIVGDDFLVTNTQRIEKAIEMHAANAVLIKLNQIGTVSETVDAINATKRAGWQPIISHRSGETEDTFIADLAVGLEAGQIKTGSLSRTDRVAKYNQLLRIYERVNQS